jgi:hypothetical protein
MTLTKEENKIVSNFLNKVSEEGGENLLVLMQFTLAKMAEDAIAMNAGKIALAQDMVIKNKKYHCRMSVQVTSSDKQNLEDRAYEIADKMLASTSSGDITRDMLQKAVLAGYNLQHEDFDDEETDDTNDEDM